jgi:hypothetical protein
MQIDPEQFSRHYASLSDDALLEIDPADLTEVARERYEQELRNRNLTDDFADEPETGRSEYEAASEDPQAADQDDDAWRDHAICACSFAQSRDADTPAVNAAEARTVLANAGIPAFIDSDPVDPNTGGRPEYRVMIPAELRLLAESLLDKEIFNASLEADWAAHLEELPDEDLLAMSADELCAGILDRAARLKRALTRELAHRGIRRG